MAYNTLLVIVWCKLILEPVTIVKASTHWMVTEDGRIQSQVDSVFNLKRPYDLMALLKQEQRAVMLETLKRELLAKKGDIDKNEDKDTGLEQRFYRSDADCITAGKPLVEFDLYTSTVLPLENKGFITENYLEWLTTPAPPIRSPDCTQYVVLDFSMHSFEHLESIRLRKNLSMAPELRLRNSFVAKENMDEYGHLVHNALMGNSTSWVLYNMAALFWRFKGDPYQAIECLRRALHYSPRQHKDVALISLGNVLHHTRYSNEAAVILHSSLDVSRELDINHFTLGNIYAVLAEYNKSVICFDNTLKVRPDFEAAEERKHAVLCHSKLEAMLESQHKSLQKTLTELKDYQHKHDQWQKQQEKLVSEQTKLEEKINQRISYESYKMKLEDEGVGEFCSMQERDGRHVLQCAWSRVRLVLGDYDFTSRSPKESIATASESSPSEVVDYNQPQRPPIYEGPLKKSESLPYQLKDWPTKEECDLHVQKFPTWNEFPTTYLSPENKGFVVKPLLGTVQGLKEGQQHPFPWYPPVCNSLSEFPEGPRSYDHLASIRDRAKHSAKLFDPSMEPVLLANVEGWEESGMETSDGKTTAELAAMTATITDDSQASRVVTRDELGQRILTALKQKVGPSWILCNLAAVYWRIVGNTAHALECMRHALYYAPDAYRDVPLLNLANILYKIGRVDDAVTAMKDALAVNQFEPESQFFMGNLLAAKGNMSGAIHHYQLALAQQPSHSAAYSSLRIINCYQKYHRASQSSVPPPPKESAAGPQPCVPGSRGRPAYTNADPETHFICSHDKDVERCYLDHQRELCHTEQGSANISPPQNGGGANMPSSSRRVTQLCSVTPILVEPWPLPGDDAQQAPLHERSNCATRSQDPVHMSGHEYIPREPCSGHLFAAPLSDTLGGPNQFIDLGRRLEDIADYYRQNGVCTDEECDRLLIQTTQNHQPHIRIEIIEGILHRSLIFSNVVVTNSDCVIFNDGRRSPGCDREEYTALVKDWDEYTLRTEDILNFLHKNKNLLSLRGNIDDLIADDLLISAQKPTSEPGVQSVYEHPAEDAASNFNLFSESSSNTVDTPTSSSSPDIKYSISFPPDPIRHIVKPVSLPPYPTLYECRHEHKRIDFQQFFSYWVSVATKTKDASRLLVPSSGTLVLADQPPLCYPHLIGRDSPLRAIESLQNIGSLKRLYRSESGLKETLLTLGGLTLAIDNVKNVGAMLHAALKSNATSWVVNNLASLYWRVVGKADKAIDCIIVAYHFSPPDAQDIALLGLTNILQKCQRLDDALLVTALAIEAAPGIVTSHFMMANLYAAKGDMERSQLFYESTLGLQPSFTPAKERLAAIRCQQLLK